MLKKIENLEERVDDIREGMVDMSVDIDIIREKANRQREELNDLGIRSRENNLLFAGFPENRAESDEDMETLVREQIAKITDPEILKKHPNLKDAVITKIHRNKQFKPDQSRPRDIIVKFLNYKERCAIMKGKKAIDEGIFVNPDYPPAVVFAERTLKPILSIVKGTPYGEKKRVKLIAGVLFVDNKRFTLHNLVALPSAIKFYQNSIKSSFEVLAWFGILSIFSNFFWAPMVIDGKEFANSEQFIQYCKALFFHDRYRMRLLLSTTDPYECKRIGHKIDGFNQDKWDEQAPKVCNKALREKVDQNSFVKQFLISTGDKILAEAAPNSKWACGLKLKDNNILDITKWERVGHGGMVYMQIRSEITGRPMPDLSKVGVPIPQPVVTSGVPTSEVSAPDAMNVDMEAAAKDD